MNNELKIEEIKPASYNPRVFDKENSLRLKESMRIYKDISGITFNRRTGNLVTGHHRFDNIQKEFKNAKLTTRKIANDLFMILANGEETSYSIRVVDWDEQKEMEANVVANSDTVQGKFNNKLKEVLSSLSQSGSKAVDGLGLSTIKIPKISQNIKTQVLSSSESQAVDKKRSKTLVSKKDSRYITTKLELTVDYNKKLASAIETVAVTTLDSSLAIEKIIDYVYENMEIISCSETSQKRKGRSK